MGEREIASGRRVALLLTLIVGNGCGLASLPLYSLSSFVSPLSRQFGWAPSRIGAAATVLTLGIFAGGPVAGRLCDRFGVCRVALPSCVCLSAGLGVLALATPSLPMFLALYGLLALAGAGTTSVAYSRSVTQHFERKRGLALGLMMSGSGLAALLMPLLLGRIIPQEGWRAGYLACAAIALLPIPLMLLISPDAKEATDGGSVAQLQPMPGLTRGEALCDRRFWQMAGGAVLFAAAVGAIVVYVGTILRDFGLSPQQAGRTGAMLGLGMIAGRMASGFLLDRMNGPLLALSLMVLTAIGFIGLAAGSPPAALPVWVLLIGLSLGSEGDLLAYFTGKYFGLRAYAELFGWAFGILAVGTAAGPLIVLALLPSLGWKTILGVFAMQCLGAAILLGTLGRYRQWA